MTVTQVRVWFGRRRRIAVAALAVMLLTSGTPPAAADSGPQSDVEPAVDTSSDVGTDDGLLEGLPTFTETLAEELGVSADELRDASRRAHDRLTELRRDRLADVGPFDPGSFRDAVEMADPERLHDVHRLARETSDAIAEEADRRLTPGSAERTAGWLIRTSDRLRSWFERLGDWIERGLAASQP